MRASFCFRQRGFTLAEAMLAIAVGMLVMAGLAQTLSVALAAQNATREENDLRTRVNFASRRIAATVMNTPVKPLSAKADPTTSGDWLTPVTYTFANGTVTETDAAGSRTVATGVTSFSITSPSVTAGLPLIEVSITVSGMQRQTRATVTTRLGGPA